VLRKFAEGIIRGDGKDPAKYQNIVHTVSATADRGYLAARVLVRLDGITAGLAIIERNSDIDIVRKMALQVVRDGFALAFELQALAMVRREQETVTGEGMLKGADRRRAIANAAYHETRSREWQRWNIEAAEIWKQHPTLSRNAVAALVKKRLGHTDEVRTIAKRLKKPGTVS
jgi:hypothetical protein